MTRPDRAFDGYIFDLDGTIYLGDALLPGALDLITRLRNTDRKILFLSNNPTRSIDAYVEKLTRLGIAVTPHEILTTLATTITWFRQHAPKSRVYPIGEQPLADALAANGIALTDVPSEIDVVLASYDRTFTYDKLQTAFDAFHLHKRARLMATNPDRYCPFPGGRGEPDAAAIVGAISGCTGVPLERHFGKPDPYMLEAALQRLGLPVEACVMVGDRLATDIRMANAAGMASALVLTGDSSRLDVERLPAEERPTWVLDGVGDLLPAQM